MQAVSDVCGLVTKKAVLLGSLWVLFYFTGYGVFVTQAIKQGDFILEYCGDLIDYEEGDALDDQTFVFYFTIKSNKYWYVICLVFLVIAFTVSF